MASSRTHVAVSPRGLRLPSPQLAFLLPSIVLLGTINAYPLVAGIALSFQSGSIIGKRSWAGLVQYRTLLQFAPFWSSVTFSLLFTVASVVGSYLAGLGLALLLHRVSRFKGFVRGGLLIPWLVPSVVAAVGFKFAVTDQHGIVNSALGMLGLGPVFFLSTPRLASFSVILLKIWRTFPFLMVTLLAARGAVAEELYEAAGLDGAGAWASFRHITMPVMARVSIVGCLLATVWSFNDFETIWLLTRGGPSDSTQNLMTESYNLTFALGDPGLGASLAVVSLLIQLVLALVLVRALKRHE